MAGTDDALAQLLMQSLLSNASPGYNRPLLPPTFGDAMTNLGRGLANYGQETLNRSMGIPYQDSVQNALARAKLAEEIQQLQLRGTARRNFPDTTKIFEPTIKREYFDTGMFDPNTDEPDVIPFENRSYTPEQKQAARMLFGVNLEDTDPSKRAAAESSAMGRRIWNEQVKDRSRNAQEALELRRQNADKDQRIKEYNLSLRRESSRAKITEHAMQHGYESQDVAKAIKGAIDPETGELDPAKVYDILPPGKSPKFQFQIKKHEDYLKAMEERLKIARTNARRLAADHMDEIGLKRFNAAARNWEQQFNVFKNNLANITKTFDLAPPDPEDYIGLSFNRGGGSPGDYRPEPRKKSGGSMDFITPSFQTDPVESILRGLRK